jgi:hypothetical protein
VAWAAGSSSRGKDLEEWGKVEYAEALRTAALLPGRRSNEWFAARWASKPGQWADRLKVFSGRSRKRNSGSIRQRRGGWRGRRALLPWLS